LGCGAKIVLGVEVTPELAAAEKPDIIVNASGGDHIIPPIEGIDGKNVVTVTDAELKKVPVGEKIVVLGGGISGLECALQFAHEGRETTIIDLLPMDKLWREVMDELRSGLVEQMEWLEVKLIDDATITRITDERVEYRKSSGETGEEPGDTFITSFGIKKNTEFNHAIKDIIPEVYVVGDARDPQNIYWANMDGFNVAVEL